MQKLINLATVSCNSICFAMLLHLEMPNNVGNLTWDMEGTVFAKEEC